MFNSTNTKALREESRRINSDLNTITENQFPTHINGMISKRFSSPQSLINHDSNIVFTPHARALKEDSSNSLTNRRTLVASRKNMITSPSLRELQIGDRVMRDGVAVSHSQLIDEKNHTGISHNNRNDRRENHSSSRATNNVYRPMTPQKALKRIEKRNNTNNETIKLEHAQRIIELEKINENKEKEIVVLTEMLNKQNIKLSEMELKAEYYAFQKISQERRKTQDVISKKANTIVSMQKKIDELQKLLEERPQNLNKLEEQSRSMTQILTRALSEINHLKTKNRVLMSKCEDNKEKEDRLNKSIVNLEQENLELKQKLLLFQKSNQKTPRTELSEDLLVLIESKSCEIGDLKVSMNNIKEELIQSRNAGKVLQQELEKVNHELSNIWANNCKNCIDTVAGVNRGEIGLFDSYNEDEISHSQQCQSQLGNDNTIKEKISSECLPISKQIYEKELVIVHEHTDISESSSNKPQKMSEFTKSNFEKSMINIQNLARSLDSDLNIKSNDNKLIKTEQKKADLSGILIRDFETNSVDKNKTNTNSNEETKINDLHYDIQMNEDNGKGTLEKQTQEHKSILEEKMKLLVSVVKSQSNNSLHSHYYTNPASLPISNAFTFMPLNEASHEQLNLSLLEFMIDQSVVVEDREFESLTHLLELELNKLNDWYLLLMESKKNIEAKIEHGDTNHKYSELLQSYNKDKLKFEEKKIEAKKKIDFIEQLRRKRNK